MISVSEVSKILSLKTDVFLTHDWGTDINKSNHKRVSNINAALQQRGITTWFDEEQLIGEIEHKMASDVDNSHVVVTFITSRYVKKIVSEKLMDNCFLEFVYAVVMESETRDIIL